MIHHKKKGFTLIELLVVIAIIGLLSTLSIVSLNNARSRARDARRISDVRQVQTALALYFNTYSQYPSSESELAHIALAGIGLGGVGEFISPIPQAPTPADGDCSSEDNSYYYLSDGTDYELSYCLGNSTGGLSAGLSYASPAFLQMAVAGCPPGEVMCGGACCANVCCEEVCCGEWATVCLSGTCQACFAAGSLVTMADGSLKAIEDMSIGDVVLSYDKESKELVSQTVVHFFDNSIEQMGSHYLEIYLANGKIIEVTPSHRFSHPLMSQVGLKRAYDFIPGDYIMTQDLDYIKIVNINKIFQPIKTYNLEISNTHTFIVDGVVVGNMRWIKEVGAAAK